MYNNNYEIDRYAKALADVTAPSQHDKLADALCGLSFEIKASLSIIKALIGLEFDRKQSHPFTILRVNSIVSKMMGKYTKMVGSQYLNTLIGDLIRDLYDKPNMDLELDKRYVVCVCVILCFLLVCVAIVYVFVTCPTIALLAPK